MENRTTLIETTSRHHNKPERSRASDHDAGGENDPAWASDKAGRGLVAVRAVPRSNRESVRSTSVGWVMISHNINAVPADARIGNGRERRRTRCPPIASRPTTPHCERRPWRRRSSSPRRREARERPRAFDSSVSRRPRSSLPSRRAVPPRPRPTHPD